MQHIQNAVNAHRTRILAAERYLWAHPALGFTEWESSRYLAEAFASLGYAVTRAADIPGFYTVLDTGRAGPTVLVLGELDAVLCPEHPDADPVSGAAHACGHHTQCAALLGVAAALRDPAVLSRLSGRVLLCAVPAEEPPTSDLRAKLKAEGKIKHFSGKREFLSRGYFDGADLAILVHLSTHTALGRGAVGALLKQVTYTGVSAHAGGAPERGKNALYAATCGVNNLNAIRESLDKNMRVHAILTHGGESVGTIPSHATLSCYLRAETLDGIARLNKKVNAALCGGGLALDCTVTTADTLTFAPLVNSSALVSLAREAADAIGLTCHYTDTMTTGSTDLGDLSCLMPVVHPFVSGAAGETHGKDYRVADPDAACITNAIWQVAILHLLLADGAVRAKRIVAEYTPLHTKASFLAAANAFEATVRHITYTEEGASIRLT